MKSRRMARLSLFRKISSDILNFKEFKERSDLSKGDSEPSEESSSGAVYTLDEHRGFGAKEGDEDSELSYNEDMVENFVPYVFIARRSGQRSDSFNEKIVQSVLSGGGAFFRLEEGDSMSVLYIRESLIRDWHDKYDVDNLNDAILHIMKTYEKNKDYYGRSLDLFETLIREG